MVVIVVAEEHSSMECGTIKIFIIYYNGSLWELGFDGHSIATWDRRQPCR